MQYVINLTNNPRSYAFYNNRLNYTAPLLQIMVLVDYTLLIIKAEK